MNIIVFTYKADISGGSNRSLLSVMEIMKSRGHQVTLVLPKKTGALYDKSKELGINCIYQPFGRICAIKVRGIGILRQYLRLYSKLYWDLMLTMFLKRKYAKLAPNIIYSNGNNIHAGRLLAKFLNIPHVWHIREFIEDYQLMPVNVYKLMENGTSKFILISNDLFSIYKQQIPEEKLEMISNGIKYIEQPPKVSHESFNILMTARICADKRQKDAIESMNNIFIKYPTEDIHLYFAGSTVTESDKIYKQECVSLMQKYGLESRITFLGEVKDMSSLRANMDIELLCSSREPFGRVTVEAMRSGLGVIASNAGGTKDIVIDGENGFVYEPGNTGELTDKILMLYFDRSLLEKVSRFAKQFSRTHFTEEQLYKTVNLLEEIGKGTGV